MPTTTTSRLKRLRHALDESGAGALLETHLPNIYYLCADFPAIRGPCWSIPRPPPYSPTAGSRFRPRKKPAESACTFTRARFWKRLASTSEAGNDSRVAVSPSRLTLAGWKALRKAAGGNLKWVAIDGLVESLRAVKDAAEIDRIRDAARLGSQVMEEAIRLIRPGVTELDIAAEIGYRMRRKGASGESFEAIVAAGPRSALPHARPTARRIGKNELVVLDLGAILRHYCSDLTRTVHVGKAPARVRQWYQAVLDAQTAARDALKAGVTCGAVDAAARNVLQHKGLGRYFVHSTGHGIGLEIHEDPRIARDQKTLLETGNVVTLEPGVYVEGVGGIRIEDDALVTPRGAEILTTTPREFLEL